VPVERVELTQLVTALLEPDWLPQLWGDAVPVPGDVPGDRDHDLAADAGERQDARVRRPEALGDARDRATEVGLVEEVGGLDHFPLRLGEAAQDRLVGDRGLGDGRRARS